MICRLDATNGIIQVWLRLPGVDPVDPIGATRRGRTSEACRAAGDPRSVVHTSYVAALRAMCPSAYAFSYDDANGLHA